MAKPTGDRDSGHWRDGGVLRAIFALLFLLSGAGNFQGEQPAFPRGRGVPNYEIWNDLGDALARPSASADLRISPNIDPEGQYNVRLVHQLPAIQDPIENIDADNADADNADVDETDLNILLAVAEVVCLPRQIERDGENMMVRRPRVSSSVAESGVTPSSWVDDVAAGAPQHPPPQVPVPETVAADVREPDVVGILAGILPQLIEDEEEAHAAPDAAPDVVGILAGILPQLIEEEDEAHAAPDAAPDVFGILAGILPQLIEGEDEAQAAPDAAAELEVAMEAFPPGMLQLISGVASLPQFAAASMTVPAGDLESNLEERMPVDHPEAGDSSADLQAEVFIQDGVENLEVEEPHAKGMQ